MQPWVGILVIGILIILWLQIANFNLLLSPQRTPAEPRTRSEFYFILFLGVQMSGIAKLAEYMRGSRHQFVQAMLATAAGGVALIVSVELIWYFNRTAGDVALYFSLLFTIELLIATFANMHYSNSRNRDTA